jgi:hypothetical protein
VNLRQIHKEAFPNCNSTQLLPDYYIAGAGNRSHLLGIHEMSEWVERVYQTGMVRPKKLKDRSARLSNTNHTHLYNQRFVRLTRLFYHCKLQGAKSLMKKIQIAVVLVFMLALLIPSAVSATEYNIFYCTYDAKEGGDGSFMDPWRCKTAGELEDVVDEVCEQIEVDGGSGILIQRVKKGYWKHDIEWLLLEGKDDYDNCEITDSIFFKGYPPHTGVSLPPSLVFSGTLAIGLSLFAVGLVVFRKRSAN